MRKIIITLNKKEISQIEEFKKEKHTERELNRARILLLLNRNKSEKDIADFLDTDYKTVWRVKKRFSEEGLMATLYDKERPGQPKKYNEKHKAEIIALACSNAPEGRSRWTLELLTEEMKNKEGCETINRETVRLTLKKTNVSLG